MTNSLSGTWLLDTNILVAFFDRSSLKNEIAKKIIGEIEMGRFKVVVSSQNILELSSVLIAGYKGSRAKVVGDIKKLLDFIGDSSVIYPTSKSLNKYLSLLRKNESVHMTDLFLAATMFSAGIDSIITNDLVFEKISGIKIYNPFIVS